jgi:amino-acid N-acetyltransferase
MVIVIGPARRGDLAPVLRLLEAAGLPVVGVAEHFGSFLVARRGEAVVGAVGLEVYGAAALFRSLVVDPAVRGRGLGRELVEQMAARAASLGVRTLYLLTTTAEEFFGRLQFQRCDRRSVPAPIAATSEFRTACPASAVCMRRDLPTVGATGG